MQNLPRFVQRILELMKRYPGVIALAGFISGVGSFILVDRQQGLASWITTIMLISWIWLMLENTLTKLFTRIFKREIPEPLLRYATQMIIRKACFLSCRSSSSPRRGTAASCFSPGCWASRH